MIEDDKTLVTRIKQGDEAAVEKVFLTHYINLCNYAYEFVRDKQTAEDIVSDGFFWLWKNRETLNIRTSLKSYLFKIVHNRCINHIQQKNVRERYSKNKVLLTKSESHKTIDDANHPLNLLITKELNTKISDAVEDLPPQCKEIFKLNRFQGLNNHEIARRLEISELTVKKQLSIALKKLREKFFIFILLLFNFLG